MFALALLLVPAAAFIAKPAAQGRSTVVTNALVGATAPMGYFDPLQFSKGKSEAEMAQFREYELKHGRVAMAALLGLLLEPNFHPLAASCHISQVSDPIKAGIELPFAGKAQIWGFCGVVELLTYYVKKGPMYKPGDLLGAAYYTDESNPLWVSYQEKELNNGRLAMLAFAGFIAQYALVGNTNDLVFGPK